MSEAPHIPIAFIPEEEPDAPPALTLIEGGEPLEPAQKPHLPFEEFVLTLREPDWENMSYEQLMGIRAQLSEYWGTAAALEVQLQADISGAHQKMVWLNGFIRDRQPTETS